MRTVVKGLAVFFGLMAVAHAHGPSRQKVEEVMVINAPPAKVWALVGKFDDLSWLPGVKGVKADGEQPGATRVITFANGEEITEELKKSDAEHYKLQYRMVGVNLDVLPVNNYSATISVEANPEGGSVVHWHGAFYRGFMNNNPPPELNEEAAIHAVSTLYKTGLANLKKTIEEGGK